MSDWYTFVQWELASRETIDFKMIYVDIAGGDILAGLLLSQIIYWNLPGKDGRSKLRVEKEGKLWLARKHSEWHTEIRMSEDQVRRALTVLKDLMFVEVKLFKFDGAPTVHIHLNRNVVASAVKKMAVSQTSELAGNPNGFGIKPKWIWDKTQMDLGQNPEPLTEITHKDYNKDLNTPYIPPKGEVSEQKKSLPVWLPSENFREVAVQVMDDYSEAFQALANNPLPQTTEKTPEPPSSAPPPLPPGFDEFWQNYPTKVAKPAALKAWKKLKPSQTLQDTILRDVAIRLVNDRRWIEGFVPNPATYLNQARWEDEIQSGPQTRPKAMTQEERNREVFANYAAKKGVKINGLN